MDRLTVPEAALRLNISEGAVRMRLHRGTLESEQDDNGRTLVLLQSDNAETTSDTTTHTTTELVDELRDRLHYVERQLEQEREANRENRRLLAAALERIPAIEAPQEAAEGPETASEESYGTSPQEAEDSLHRRERSWWQRWFGLE